MAATPLRVAVVSGTARPHGIGRAVARGFIRQGYNVLGVDKLRLQDPETDEALGPNYAHVVLDIAAPQEVAFVARSCQQHFGTSAIHVLVNNAGNADPHMPQQAEAAAAHWRSMIDTNLTGAFLMSQAVLPHMPPGDAAILHISSSRAHQSEPHTEAYAAAKAGLLGLTHAQAISLAHKVRVNAVLPGWIDTSGDPASITAADHAWHPAGRVGVPEDVAELCLFLADPSKAAFITGQEFVVDGGVGKKMMYPEEAAAEAEAAAVAAATAEAEAVAEQEQEQQAQGGGQAEVPVEEERPPIIWPDA